MFETCPGYQGLERELSNPVSKSFIVYNLSIYEYNKRQNKY